jgi:hypothetical protein
MKLQASDLRLGNWINVKCVAEELKGIDGWDAQPTNIHNIQGLLKGNPDFLYEAIPLTEEWLLRAGFEKDGFNAYNKSIALHRRQYKVLCFSGDYLFLREANTDMRHEDSLCTLWNMDIKKQFYVHELQNLYFDLMGVELTFI